jgi:hypothetical protein
VPLQRPSASTFQLPRVCARASLQVARPTRATAMLTAGKSDGMATRSDVKGIDVRMVVHLVEGLRD